MFISLITPLPAHDQVSRQLNKYFSWNSDDIVRPKNIQDHLCQEAHIDSLHKLNVYNVGQGSLSAVTDEYNTPLLYYDLGGGFGFNRFTYPQKLELCFSKAKSIILSHWDLDHVETARRYLNENQSALNGLTWIAPEQKVTSYYYKLAARLVAAGGKLLLWSNFSRNKTIDFWAGQLIKCNGPDKNHSGLALVVKSHNNFIKKVLHPGDAAYQYIPGFHKLNLDGIVATHHGANFDFNNYPIPITNQCAIAYSYYTPTRYGHPKADSVNAHSYAGWTNRCDTIGGHISFTRKLLIRNPPRGGKICGLTNFQTF